MRRGAAVLWLLLACGKGDQEPPRPDPVPAPEPLLPDPGPPPAPPPPAEPEPLAADPLSLEPSGDAWELRGDGLPAVSADGRRLARVLRRWDGATVTRLALLVEEPDTGRQVHEVVIWEARRDRRSPRARLDKRVAQGNALLAAEAWRSLVPAEAVFPDGWIRCDLEQNIEQKFEVGGFSVSWHEPRLRVLDRRGKPVIDEDRPGWVVEQRPKGCGRSYVGGAWLDPQGLLVIEVDHCGSCGVAPLTVLERWEPT